MLEPGRDRAGSLPDGPASAEPTVRLGAVEVIYAAWHVLRRATRGLRRRGGTWTTQDREDDQIGHGVAVLLHAVQRGDGLLMETPAGARGAEDPVAAGRREVAEELGVDLGRLVHVFHASMSPGSSTQRTHCYAASCTPAYTAAQRTGPGGGLAEEGEDIEALEPAFTDAMAMIRDGRITDAKTIMLLQRAALESPFADHPRG